MVGARVIQMPVEFKSSALCWLVVKKAGSWNAELEAQPSSIHRPASHLLTFLMKIDARVRVISFPIEPVVFERRDFLKSSSGERARSGRAAKVPAASGLTVEQVGRSEEHTSEDQSRQYLVCRLLLEKKQNRLYK